MPKTVIKLSVRTWLRSTCKLQTREQIGYVVTDIDGRFSPAALAELAQVAGTVRMRVLF